MSLSNDGASSKASEDYKVEVSAEDRLEEEEVETPEEIQPAQNEMENAPANAQPAVNDDDAIEILENMQIRILTEIYDELMREIVEDMLQIIEEGMLEELSFELLTIAIEDIHQDNQIAAGGQHEPMNIDSDSESIPFEYDEFEQHNNVLIITQMDSDDDGDDGDDENDDDDDDEDSDGWMEDDEGDDGDDDDDDDSDFELDAQELIYDELFNNLFEIEAFKRTYFGGYNPDNDDSDGSDSSDDGAANPPGHWQVELHQANAGPIIIQLPSGDSVGNIELEYGYYLDSDDED